MFEDVIKRKKSRWVHWRGHSGSALEEFLDNVTEPERTTLIARMRAVACHGVRESAESTGTFVERVARPPEASIVDLLVLRGNETQVVFVRTGNTAIVVDAGPLGTMSAEAVITARKEARRLLSEHAKGQKGTETA